MYAIIKNTDQTTTHVQEFVCDTMEDINNLPLDCEPGSTCIIIDSSDVMMLNTNREWVLL